MKIITSNYLRVYILFIFIVLSFFIFVPNAWASKVNTNITTTTLTEGQSQIVTVTLDEPIICPVQDETCKVVLPLASQDTNRVTTSLNTLTWNSDEWFQARQFTINALEDGVQNINNIIQISYSKVVSNSEYYKDFQPATISVTIIDTSPPTTTTTTTPSLVSPSGSFGAESVDAVQKRTVPGSKIIVSGFNFKANTQVEVMLYSTPQSLGSYTTDANGYFSVRVKIPVNAKIGSHNIVLMGQDVLGNQASVTLELNITAGLANTGISSFMYITLFGLSFILIGLLIIYLKSFRTRIHL